MTLWRGWISLGLYFGGLLSYPFFGPALAQWAGGEEVFHRLAVLFALGHAAGLAAGGYYHRCISFSAGRQGPGDGGRNGRDSLAGMVAVGTAAAMSLGLLFFPPAGMGGGIGMIWLFLFGFASGWPVALFGRWLASPAAAGGRGLLMGRSILLGNVIYFIAADVVNSGRYSPEPVMMACALMFAVGGALMTGLPAVLPVSPSRCGRNAVRASLPPLGLLLVGCLVYFTGGLYYQTVLPSYASISPAWLLLVPYLIGTAVLGPWSDRKGRGGLLVLSLFALGCGFALWSAGVQLGWLAGVAHMAIIFGLLCMDLFYWTFLVDSAPPGSGSLTLGWGLSLSVLAITLPAPLAGLLPREMALLQTAGGTLGVLSVILALIVIREGRLDFSTRHETGRIGPFVSHEDPAAKAGADPASPGRPEGHPAEPGGGAARIPQKIFERQFISLNLTSREREIAFFLLNEFSTAEILNALCISQNTLKYHIKNILRKTETGNRQEFRDKFRALKIDDEGPTSRKEG